MNLTHVMVILFIAVKKGWKRCGFSGKPACPPRRWTAGINTCRS